jgi:hypothetical protein
VSTPKIYNSGLFITCYDRNNFDQIPGIAVDNSTTPATIYVTTKSKILRLDPVPLNPEEN